MTLRPAYAALCAVSVAGAICLPILPFLQPAERQAQDVRLGFRRSAPWPADLLMMPVTDADIREQGRWPWGRDQIARLLRTLRLAEAKTVAVDLVFNAASDGGFDGDLRDALGDAVIAAGYTPNADGPPLTPSARASMIPSAAPPEARFRAADLLPPLEGIGAGAAGIGHVFVSFGADGLVRGHIPLVSLQGETGSLPSLALAAWLHQRDLDPKACRYEDGALVLPDGRRLPLHSGETWLDLELHGPMPPALSAGALLDSKDLSLFPKIRGKLVVVYLESRIAGDRFPTPLSTTTPGGLLTALAIRTFDGGRVPRPVPPIAILLAIFFPLLAAAPLLVKRTPGELVAGTAAALALLGLLAIALVPMADVFVPVAMPAALLVIEGGTLAALSSRLSEGERERLRGLLRAAGEAPTVRTPEIAPPQEPSGAQALLSARDGWQLPNPVQIGRYRIERCLGRGGMGAIFLAHDAELDRRVAVKVLHETDRDAFDRFRREAIAVARISHPHVVQIHEIGMDAQVPYLVLEYVGGGTLSQWIADPDAKLPLPWRTSVEIVSGVAAGLGAAHARGIVHRDVKPSNVLLTERFGSFAKVADFGIAKLGGQSHTREGTVIGTVGYLSPEQAMGIAVGPASDVFSLGLTWYRLLTGRPAWEGTTAEIVQATMRKPLPDPRAFNPDLPAPLADLFARMVDLEPGKRPADGGEAAAALRALLT